MNTIPDAARLSRLLFEAREIADMYDIVVRVQKNLGDGPTWPSRLRDEIDAYRRSRGWHPHGFGGEE